VVVKTPLMKGGKRNQGKKATALGRSRSLPGAPRRVGRKAKGTDTIRTALDKKNSLRVLRSTGKEMSLNLYERGASGWTGGGTE